MASIGKTAHQYWREEYVYALDVLRFVRPNKVTNGQCRVWARTYADIKTKKLFGKLPE